jgi:hypothetical protein
MGEELRRYLDEIEADLNARFNELRLAQRRNADAFIAWIDHFSTVIRNTPEEMRRAREPSAR